MSRIYKRYCKICGSRVSNRSSAYCEKHAEYSNRPKQAKRKYCTWCGRTMPLDEYRDECEYCREREENIKRKCRENLH